MNLMLDTHLLLWVAGHPDRLSATARGLLDNDYRELAITSAHVIEVELLPQIHQDPFDRILVAQAMVEGITLL
jgi:PIN domain nuclease of toxin-antitoxin system